MTRETLKRIKAIRKAYERNTEAIYRLNAEITRITPQLTLACGKGADRDRMAEYVVKLEELEQQRQTVNVEYEMLLNEVDKWLATLPENEAEVIRKRYIEEFHGWQRVAWQMHYSERMVKYFHFRALERLP